MHIYDLLGVGIGPFNLSLAALLNNQDIDCLFFDKKDHFNWHGGMMLDDASLQVPFLADLVTMVDPTNSFSFLNYLKHQGRLFPFFYKENFFILRKEYNDYCQWVADQCKSCQFSTQVIDIRQHTENNQSESLWLIETRDSDNHIQQYLTRHIVLGVGSTPYIPSCLEDIDHMNSACHSSQYRYNKDTIKTAKNITVLGSGQSAAEIVLDVLSWKAPTVNLNWLTRSKGFFPMEYSNLGLEHFSPNYVDYFYHLDAAKKKPLIKSQDLLYKGMSVKTISAIYQSLYNLSLTNDLRPVIMAHTELQSITGMATTETEHSLNLKLYHREQEQNFSLGTDYLISATGYQPFNLKLFKGINDHFLKDGEGDWIISRDYRLVAKDTGEPANVFVQNAEMHTHGIGAPDLTLTAYRSGIIANVLLGRTLYQVDNTNTLTQFGVPNDLIQSKTNHTLYFPQTA